MLRRFIIVLLLVATVGTSTVAARPGTPESVVLPPAPAILEAATGPPALAMVEPAAPQVNVAIQAGHWKVNELPDALSRLRGSTGASGGGRTEAQVNLDIAQRVARLLRDKGLTAEVLPATVPTGYRADLFIALHADGSNSNRARGYKVSTRWRSDVAALDAVLVQAIAGAYGRVTGMPGDGSITRAMRGYYAYSTYRGESYRLGATTPAAILEMGFMTSPADRALMFNSPELVARGVVAGITDYYAALREGQQLQATVERQAAAAPVGRSVMVLGDGVNIRAGVGTDTRRVAGADFGDTFALLETTNNRPSGGTIDGHQGTQLVSGSGWYKISVPGLADPAYISRDMVVVQQ